MKGGSGKSSSTARLAMIGTAATAAAATDASRNDIGGVCKPSSDVGFDWKSQHEIRFACNP